MKRYTIFTALLLYISIGSSGVARADLNPGLISDFNDGTEQGWSPPKDNTSNVANYLEVLAAPRLAAFTTDVAGTISPSVSAIQVDMFRPNGEADLDMRLVLMGPGTNNRWTSTASQVLPGDGGWATYTFSILEADLTQVAGANTYADLTGELNRLMFRHNAGVPDVSGTPGTGSFGMDNVIAIPEPASLFTLGACGVMMLRRRYA